MSRPKRELTVTVNTPKESYGKKARVAGFTPTSKTPKTKSVLSVEGRGVVHPYHTYNANTLGIGTFLNDYKIRGNGMYDPEYAVGGSQPFGFDQYAAIYRKFYVKSSEVKVLAMWNSNTESNGCLLVWADANPTDPISPKVAHERCLANGGKIKYLNNVYSPAVVITHKAYTKKILKSGMSEDNNHGTGATDPSEQWYWHIVNTNEDATVAKGARLFIDVKYESVWTEPILNVGS